MFHSEEQMGPAVPKHYPVKAVTRGPVRKAQTSQKVPSSISQYMVLAMCLMITARMTFYEREKVILHVHEHYVVRVVKHV